MNTPVLLEYQVCQTCYAHLELDSSHCPKCIAHKMEVAPVPVGIRSVAQSYLDKQLYCSVSEKKLNRVKLLLRLGANPNTPVSNGNTAFHIMSDSEMRTVLLDHKADINAQNGVGNTALHIATHWDDSRQAHELLSWGADPTILNGEGKRPLEYAMSPEMKDLLFRSTIEFEEKQLLSAASVPTDKGRRARL